MTAKSGHAKATLVKNTVILAVGKFSSQLITFLMLPLYTAFLSPSEYGIVDVVITYVALLAPAITIQMEMAVFRFLIEARENEIEKTRIISNSLQIVLAMLLLFFPGAIVVQSFVNVPYIWIILGIIAMAVFSGLCLQIARGLGKNFNYAIASIVIGVMTAVSNFVLIVYLEMGASGLLLSMLLAYSVSTVYLVLSLRLYRYVSFGVSDKGLRKKLLKYAAPLVPNSIAWWVINAADRTIILLVLGLAANGIYAIASKFPLIYTAVFAVFGLSWTESASVHINDKDRGKFFSDTFDAAFRFFGSIGLGIIASLPFVFPILVNERYEEAYVYIPVMILGALFNSIVGLYGAVYVAKKMTGKVATTSIMAAAISISINLLFINFIGLFSAAVANAVAFLSMAIYRHYDLKKYVTISYRKSLIFKLAFLYSTVIVSYYLDYFYLNIATIASVIIIAYILNRGAVGFLKTRLSSRFRSSTNM
ncbi:lipopolysaccharide biosynthesis protein [Corynebacterium comes]|uniref:Polysaccharide biosynthesis protein n=1 Tax=Corynebacterium comes TaxID=2675218 RepID=A0A6B8VIH2_9CORY|nr:oligosaccharide flippase family protein [Corynebacterium comes]QGU05142.1 Polysaccharide biosynthesis protein [Corynebacterium comes]